MALPKLNAGPSYQMVIPSTKEKVNYRPFLVKEEKNLMIAMESNDPKSTILTLLDTIKSCVSEPLSVDALTSFDMEYMFLQIRSKSVGETTKIGMNCSECGTKNELEVPLDTIKVDVPEMENRIELSDTITLEMGWPTATDLVNSGIGDEASTEELFTLMTSCFKYVETEDERINMRDEAEADVKAFVESMSSVQFNKVKHYIEKMPRLKHDIEFDCSACNHHNKTTLEGLNAFLS